MIPIIKDRADLDWYIDDTWHAVVFTPTDNKKAIMDWLYDECENDIVVSQLNEPTPPPMTTATSTSISTGSVWGMAIYPQYEAVYRAHFADMGEAMMFKLAWGG